MLVKVSTNDKSRKRISSSALEKRRCFTHLALVKLGDALSSGHDGRETYAGATNVDRAMSKRVTQPHHFGGWSG